MALLCLLLLGACSSILRNPVPEHVHLETTVLGRDDLRFWGDRSEFDRKAYHRDPDALRASATGIVGTEHNYLAISGGGADGAYGAGVLVGWSELGTRPPFTMVTGVSTGALTAPFVYLGEQYDEDLQMLSTPLDSSRIFLRRSLISILRGDSIADNAPLLSMLKTYIDEDMIEQIAAEHRKGRLLLIGTSNLDAGRPMVWNIGAIANSGHPGAGDLIRQVLLASTAIPGVFPPAYIQVQGPDGRTYDEMHVDGGTSAQMFLYPSRTDWSRVLDILEVPGTPTAYVIRNSRVETDYKPVRARLPDIGARSVASLIRTQGIGDAYRIAAITHRDGVALELTWIPTAAPTNPGQEIFDPGYMSELFSYGHQRMLQGEAFTPVNMNRLTRPGTETEVP